MKPTFPVRSFPWAHYAVPALFCVIATVASVLVYEGLPERLARNFRDGRPAGWMTKGSYVALMLGSMWGILVLFLALDRLLVYRMFPAPEMSAGTGAMELLCLAEYLNIIKVNVYGLEGVPASISAPVVLVLLVAYVAIHCMIARRRGEEPQSPPLWVDYPPHGLLDTVFFFVRPFLPGEVRAYEEGLILRAWLYTFAVPWETIESITHATRWEVFAGSATRMVSSPSRAVRLTLSGVKLPLIFSIEDERRLVEEWEKRRAQPSG